MITQQAMRRIRSYVRREGRMSSGQRHALQILWQKYGLELSHEYSNFSAIFAHEAPLILEIGFGMGQSLLKMAQQHPGNNYLGIEVHRPGVGALLAAVEANQITNLKVFCADAIEVITKNIADNCLSGIQIFFSDPWPKKRHHKRRLIQTVFVELLWQKLQTNGFVHLATDWEDYAMHMLAVFSQHKGFKNQAGEGQFSPRPASRPLTKFEERGQKLGHGIWDLIFVKI